jgi:hypothetical protein
MLAESNINPFDSQEAKAYVFYRVFELHGGWGFFLTVYKYDIFEQVFGSCGSQEHVTVAHSFHREEF